MEKEMTVRDIYEKVSNLLDEKKVRSTNDTISFYEFEEACNTEFLPYSKHFYNFIDKRVKKLNNKSLRNNLCRHKLPYIENVIPEVIEGKPLVTIYFVYDYKPCGKMEIYTEIGSPTLVDFDRNDFDSEKIVSYLNECNSSFCNFIGLLSTFCYKYETDYKWDPKYKGENSKLVLSDGFFEGSINLEKEESCAIGLVSSYRTSEVYEYFSLYNDSYKKRLAVDINSLPDLYKKIVDKHYNITNQRVLKR